MIPAACIEVIEALARAIGITVRAAIAADDQRQNRVDYRRRRQNRQRAGHKCQRVVVLPVLRRAARLKHRIGRHTEGARRFAIGRDGGGHRLEDVGCRIHRIQARGRRRKGRQRVICGHRRAGGRDRDLAHRNGQGIVGSCLCIAARLIGNRLDPDRSRMIERDLAVCLDLGNRLILAGPGDVPLCFFRVEKDAGLRVGVAALHVSGSILGCKAGLLRLIRDLQLEVDRKRAMVVAIRERQRERIRLPDQVCIVLNRNLDAERAVRALAQDDLRVFCENLRVHAVCILQRAEAEVIVVCKPIAGRNLDCGLRAARHRRFHRICRKRGVGILRDAQLPDHLVMGDLIVSARLLQRLYANVELPDIIISGRILRPVYLQLATPLRRLVAGRQRAAVRRRHCQLARRNGQQIVQLRSIRRRNRILQRSLDLPRVDLPFRRAWLAARRLKAHGVGSCVGRARLSVHTHRRKQ